MAFLTLIIALFAAGAYASGPPLPDYENWPSANMVVVAEDPVVIGIFYYDSFDKALLKNLIFEVQAEKDDQPFVIGWLEILEKDGKGEPTVGVIRQYWLRDGDYVLEEERFVSW
ncbi:MAG: hypothetical protein HYW89_03220 [Candidatus Sungiibacteriota bacterium]|uniref:Uncharacterized protein n=1 Tax=Candidatus Sungiibacteriota bacterium TaxID=2750080 RepID=A0A7T5RIW3_9BACT|nr:MAG: hypothetical protein HYW89_03220 [Candidatus Sungbacteria bacterium]